jgi:hypothetical protein
VEHQEIVDRRARVADRLRKRVRGLHGEARPEQPGVERDVAHRDGARGRVPDRLPDAEVLEEVAGAGLAHVALVSRPRHAGKTASGPPVIT